jgi:hypothetical protein
MNPQIGASIVCVSRGRLGLAVASGFHGHGTFAVVCLAEVGI